MISPNSATYWLPRLGIVSALSERVPQTVTVPYDHAALIAVMEGDGKAYPEWGRIVHQVRAAAESVGYPVFVRTDLASAKHDGPAHYILSSPLAATNLLCRIAEDNEIKLWLNPESPCAFLVRQFLDLDAAFECPAFGGLPIAREWRVFATESEILCAHPYWPEEVFESAAPGLPADWRERLADLHERPPADEWQPLCDAALMAAAACDRAKAWSVDFAKDRSGKWWLIDMAVAEQSWHWPDCPNARRA